MVPSTTTESRCSRFSTRIWVPFRGVGRSPEAGVWGRSPHRRSGGAIVAFFASADGKARGSQGTGGGLPTSPETRGQEAATMSRQARTNGELLNLTPRYRAENPECDE